MASRKKIKTPLEDLLDETSTQEFADYLERRYTSISNQLNADFWPNRKRFDQQMKDDFTWRSGGSTTRQGVLDRGISVLQDEIFDKSNDSLNIVGGFAAFATARAVDDIKGTDPYYALSPEGLADENLAADMQKHSEWKLRKSNLGDAIDDAIDLAFGLGEGVIKLRWKREVDVFEKRASVLYHTGLKQAVTTSTGEYVFEGDEMAEGQEPATDEAGAPIVDQMTGDQVMASAMTVAKDPALRLDPASLIWKEMAVEDVNIRYNGVKAEVMHYADFICPLTEPNIDDSNFVGHRIQMRLSEAIEEWNLTKEQISLFQSEDNDEKTAARTPNPEDQESAENNEQYDRDDPKILFCECWVKYDPVGDGRTRRIKAVLAVEARIIVHMDYMANSTPEGILPFFVQRAYRVKNRWYGRGMYETYDKAQEFIDRQLNRIEYRNRYHTNPAKFLDVSGLVEKEDTEEPFEITPGRTHHKMKGVKTDEIFSIITLPDLDERTWQLMQFMIQIIQVRSGVTSAAQGEVSSMPSTATATGIESILQSASTLMRLPIGNLKEDLEPAVLYACKLIYANVDQDEVFSYFDGDTQKAGTLLAESVKDIDMNVRLLLTRFKQREDAENSMKAISVVNWYLAIPEQEKSGPRIVAMQAIKGYGFNQADQIIRPPIQLVQDPITGLMVDPTTGQPPQAQLPAPGGGKPPSP